MEPLISYESIRAVHRAEKGEQLSKLPTGFFDAVQKWLAHKANMRDTNSIIELESAKRLLEDIINRRQRKIVHAALACMRGAAPPKNMTLGEEKFFEAFVELLRKNKSETRELVFGQLETEKKLKEAKEAIKDLNKLKKVKLLVKLPELAGPDGKVYGPYESGQAAELPSELAELLIKRNAAEAIE